MGLLLKRINIAIEDEKTGGIQGDLSSHCIALGLNIAWIFCILYSSGSASAVASGAQSVPIALDFAFQVCFLVCFAGAMLCAAITDQRFLYLYTAKRFTVVATILASCGTLLLHAAYVFGAVWIMGLAALATALGSALLTLFIGTAFSRENTATIFFNSAIAMAISISVYTIIVRFVSPDLHLIAAALLPVVELPVLWFLTPESYIVRHAVPIFNPLPVRKPGFMLRLAPPAVLFGIALGALRDASLVSVLDTAPLSLLPFVLTLGTIVSLLFMVISFSVGASSSWNDLLRPIVPFVALATLLIPSIVPSESIIASSFAVAGVLALGSILWSCFGQLSQEFRLSPVFVFSVAETFLSAGLLIESALAHAQLAGNSFFTAEIPYSAVLVFMLLLGYSMMPSIQDIKRMLLPSVHTSNSRIAQVNDMNKRHIAPGNPSEEDRALNLGSPVSEEYEYDQDKEAQRISAPVHGDSCGESPLETSTMKNSTFFTADDGAANDENRKTGWFTERCEEIANRYLLSRRETEVLFLLAKNYNAGYIQDKLCISRSTAKTHIAHIYRKLDIHTQNELINMVEEGREKRNI